MFNNTKNKFRKPKAENMFSSNPLKDIGNVVGFGVANDGKDFVVTNSEMHNYRKGIVQFDTPYGDTFYANIKARNAQRPITITGAEVTSGEYPISWLRPLKGTMTVDGDTAIISDVYSSTLRLESESNLRIKEVKVYYYYAVSGVIFRIITK